MFDDIAAINQRHRELMAYGWRGNISTGLLHTQRGIDPPPTIRTGQNVADYAAAPQEGQTATRRDLETVMRESVADIWISPAATGPAPEGIHATGDPIMNLPWTHAGVPTITIPAGKAQNGLPLGLQCASAFGTDEQLLQWAAHIERVFAEK
jgi:Asp-tRNA(Asn)/Glu-tRNA(Gln) amidotransferase A subunit family amidase